MTLTIELPNDTYEAVYTVAGNRKSTAKARVEMLVEDRAQRPMPTEDGKRWLIGLPPLQNDLDDLPTHAAPVPTQAA